MDIRRESLRCRPGADGIGLEERVVMSGSYSGTEVGFWGLRHYLIGDNTPTFLYKQYARPTLAPPSTVRANYDSQVQAGFLDLIDTAGAATNSYLSNLTGTGARTTFESTVLGGLDALTAQLTSQFALLGPSANGLTQNVQQLILGTASTSLTSVLSQVPDPPTSTGNAAAAFGARVSNAIAVTREQVLADVNVYLSSHGLLNRSYFSRASGHATVVPSVRSQNLAVIRNAFAGFNNDYALGAGALLAGSTPTTISTNRPTFDVDAQSAANSLASILTSTLAVANRSSGTLIPAVQERLLGAGGLLDQLNALPDPTDNAGSSAASFGTNSGTLISSAYRDVTRLYKQFAAGRSVTVPDRTEFNPGFGGGFNGFGFGYIPTPLSESLYYVPTYLQGHGFTNSLLGLGEDGPAFVFGTTQYGQDNGLSQTAGFNPAFNAAFTKATGLNYTQAKPIRTGLF